MLGSTRGANPPRPRRITWLVVGLVVLTGALALVVIAFAVSASTSSGASPRSAPVAAPVSQGCPKNLRTVSPSSRRGAERIMVPPGVLAVMLCRYGFPRKDRLLVTSVVASRRTTKRLARELNALPKRSGTYACPMDIGAQLVALFRYAQGPADPVTVDLSGCNPVSNGHVRRLGLGRGVIARIARLVPPPSAPTKG